jgi:hypothetical protein
MNAAAGPAVRGLTGIPTAHVRGQARLSRDCRWPAPVRFRLEWTQRRVAQIVQLSATAQIPQK